MARLLVVPIITRLVIVVSIVRMVEMVVIVGEADHGHDDDGDREM